MFIDLPTFYLGSSNSFIKLSGEDEKIMSVAVEKWFFFFLQSNVMEC
jgi:hypothetical protein